MCDFDRGNACHNFLQMEYSRMKDSSFVVRGLLPALFVVLLHAVLPAAAFGQAVNVT